VFEYCEHWWTPADNSLGSTFVCNQATSDAWFRPWHRRLAARGVDIRLGSRVTRIVTRIVTETERRAEAAALYGTEGEGGVDGEERIAYVECVLDGEPVRVEADHYVCALPIEIAAKLLPSSYPCRDSFARLAAITRQDTVGIQVYWRQPVRFEMPRTGIFLLDSPWQILIESQGVFWSDPASPIYAAADSSRSSS
jgi:hypothetical protein